MTTFAQLQARGLSFLKAQVGKGYSEDPGQNFGPNTYDCQGLAYCTYKAAANLVTGPGIGLIGSRAQFELSTVKMQPSDPWLVLDQLFFNGATPPLGHTGMFVGMVDGAYTMISALDTASGVCYSTIDPSVTTGGLGFAGRTRPLSLLVPYIPPAPPIPRGGEMILVQTTGPQVGSIPPNAWFEYEVTDGVRYALHVIDEADLNVLKIIYGKSWVTLTTAEFNELDCTLIG